MDRAMRSRNRGFTLIEVLVVIGILVILTAAGIAGVKKAMRVTDQAKCRELVSNCATAMGALFQRKGIWPKPLRAGGAADGVFDEKVAYMLAAEGLMSLNFDEREKITIGLDRFGILDPWGAAYIKKHGSSATLGSKLVGGGTLEGHRLHYALDLDGDGAIEANVGGEKIRIRANVAVWAGGRDGIIEPYSKGLKQDDVYSWTIGQTRGVK